MLAALRTRGSRGANEFEEYRMRQVTAESGPVVRPTRLNMDTASTFCHADDVQLQQKTSRLYHPRSLERRQTEGHSVMRTF